LTAAGVEQIFSDKISGSKDQRDGLEKLLAIARKGDCIVVWRLDRLARSLKHLIELSALFESRGIQLISLNENIDTTTTTGKLFLQIFGASASLSETRSSNAPVPASRPQRLAARTAAANRYLLIGGPKASKRFHRLPLHRRRCL
jgi:hypothetical protein